MASARLLVERGSLKDQSEDWGEWRFAALPSPADRLTVSYDGNTQYLTVLCVHHRVEPAASGIEPGACVVAKWTGCA